MHANYVHSMYQSRIKKNAHTLALLYKNMYVCMYISVEATLEKVWSGRKREDML